MQVQGTTIRFLRGKKVPFKQTLNRKTYMEVKYVYLHRTFRVKFSHL